MSAVAARGLFYALSLSLVFRCESLGSLLRHTGTGAVTLVLAMMRCRISHIQHAAVPPTPTAAAQVSSVDAADAALLLSISVQPGSMRKRKRD